MTLVSDNIRYLRKLNGLTQEQFSRKINIKRSLLGAYEEGRANPNQQNMQAIAKAFNTTVELLTRQDLRKLRETPNLSIPLGQATTAEPVTRHATIRSDGKIDAHDDDPFQHPDFPDIFAEPAPKTPEPQPLTNVLNKFYRQDEPREPRPAPIPPVITPPARPTNERAQSTAFQPVTGNSPVDHLFGQPAELRPATPPMAPAPPARPAESSGFNNVYEAPNAVNRSAAVLPTVQSIPVVRQNQFGEYGQRYQQPDFLHRLPAMQLPTLPAGTYRAFEAGDDFAFPGALLVGQFVRNWFDIADGKQYMLVIHNQGICYRRVYNQVKIKGTLLLTADRPNVPNQEVPLKDVAEVWEICAFVSQQLPPPATNTDRLRQLVEELRFEVERL
ncbi:helix-turn-helix domain-containing protein [Spirosoma montaniterrae]|uniref:XRE family transcriptional regulator n=1 Tax=Spirosoma montaniterrae TaxID=1178516 RepID=A0A1P9WSM4_9BACT|nr:helix-turn-helix transcriptional regulator [Spirosoma montaniterrae]AQG78368.1 XRE family transcriptional regulator [Spirosoma montaniterrae]